MEQHDQERSWKSDPRLHHMDAKKIALLASFADELAAAPEAQRMNLFLDLHRKMRQSNLVFSSEERDLLFSILTENLSPDGRKKRRNDPSPCRTVPAKIRRILFQQNFEKSAAGKDIRGI